MERVVRYVNDKFRKAGNSREAQSQKEELIADLNDKVRDAMARGETEEEAFREAAAAMDGMEELADMLGGGSRTLYVNRLNLCHALLLFAVIAVEFLAMGLLYFFCHMAGQAVTTTVELGLCVALAATAIYPAVCSIIYTSNPKKNEKIEFNFQKNFVPAVIGWLAISIGLAIINFALMPLMSERVLWFLWPTVGVSNWPASITIYNILYKSKNYVAK